MDSLARGVFAVPAPFNEPERSYAPGSRERRSLQGALSLLEAERQEFPLVIGGREVRSSSTHPAVMPHRKEHVLADVHQARAEHVREAIEAAGAAWQEWHRWPWTERAAIFLRAAALLAGPWRETLVAATMLGQSKTLQQAEADICELVDFFRFNVALMRQVYEEQPLSTRDAWNRVEYRPLEGFVLAVTPFNFTAIAGNLPTTCALMGNTVVWKPAGTAAVAAHYVMRLLEAAGLPPGVINLVHGPGKEVAEVALASPELAGIHFTGSTEVFRALWRRVGENLDRYRGFPRLVGETGGKDFVIAHESANVDEVATAVVRGAFEYQGQKCSAASRLFAPASMWRDLAERLSAEVSAIRMGDVGDLEVYMGAVIDESSFEKQRTAIADAAAHPETTVVAGGGTDASVGFFVEPTVIETRDPDFRLLRDELFGPIVTAYVFPDGAFGETLELVDRATPYGLTGSVFATEQDVLALAERKLEYAAGNLYLNDKPTGAMVGQQPFGGSRASGTNDKTGTVWHMARWVTPRTIKETWLPAGQVDYPSSGARGGELAAAIATDGRAHEREVPPTA
jgi:1-pyrroline-5-carboxylate dehydrogenase